MNIKKSFLKKGFTLLEILVVIGIIAIIVAVVSVSYSTAQKKARDTKRKDDLNSFRACMEQYYAYNNNFKYSVDVNKDPIISTDSLNCGSSTMSIQDPLNNATYRYVLSNTDAVNQTTYTICTTLEAETVTSYCLSNQQ